MASGFVPFVVPHELLEHVYCPTCGRPLSSRESLDPLVHALVCPRGHRYFFPKGAVATQAAENAASLPSIGSGELQDVTREWLGREGYRYLLHDQIAWTLRRVYEIELLNQRVRPPRDPYKHCAICGALTHDSGMREGGYARRKACTAGHDFAIHTNSATFSYFGDQVHLEGELSDQNTIYLANTWATSEQRPAFSGMVHDDLCQVFAAFVVRCGETLG